MRLKGMVWGRGSPFIPRSSVTWGLEGWDWRGWSGGGVPPSSQDHQLPEAWRDEIEGDGLGEVFPLHSQVISYLRLGGMRLKGMVWGRGSPLIPRSSVTWGLVGWDWKGWSEGEVPPSSQGHKLPEAWWDEIERDGLGERFPLHSKVISYLRLGGMRLNGFIPRSSVTWGLVGWDWRGWSGGEVPPSFPGRTGASPG